MIDYFSNYYIREWQESLMSLYRIDTDVSTKPVSYSTGWNQT